MTLNRGFTGDGIIGCDEKKTQASWDPPLDNFLEINSSYAPSQSNESYWVLKYSFFMNKKECSEPTYRRHRILFNPSSSSGVMPGLATSGSCAPALDSIGIEDQVQANETCLLMSSPQPDPVTCSFRVKIQAVDGVSKAMVDKTTIL
jgi:hypothetical protein